MKYNQIVNTGETRLSATKELLTPESKNSVPCGLNSSLSTLCSSEHIAPETPENAQRIGEMKIVAKQEDQYLIDLLFAFKVPSVPMTRIVCDLLPDYYSLCYQEKMNFRSIIVMCSLTGRPMYWSATGLVTELDAADLMIKLVGAVAALRPKWLSESQACEGSKGWCLWMSTNVPGFRMTSPCPAGLRGLRRRSPGDFELELMKAGIHPNPGPLFSGDRTFVTETSVVVGEVDYFSCGYISIGFDYHPAAPFEANVYAMIYIAASERDATWVTRPVPSDICNVITDHNACLLALSYASSGSTTKEVTHDWLCAIPGTIWMHVDPGPHSVKVVWGAWANPKPPEEILMEWPIQDAPLWTTPVTVSTPEEQVYLRRGALLRRQRLMHALNGNTLFTDKDLYPGDAMFRDETGTFFPVELMDQIPGPKTLACDIKFSTVDFPPIHSTDASKSCPPPEADTFPRPPVASKPPRVRVVVPPPAPYVVKPSTKKTPIMPIPDVIVGELVVATTPAVITTPTPEVVNPPLPPAPTPLPDHSGCPASSSTTSPPGVINTAPTYTGPTTFPLVTEKLESSSSTTTTLPDVVPSPSSSCTVPEVGKTPRKHRPRSQGEVAAADIPQYLRDSSKRDLSARVFVWLTDSEVNRNTYALLSDCADCKVLLCDASDEVEIVPKVSHKNSKPVLGGTSSAVPSSSKPPGPPAPPSPDREARRQQRLAVTQRLASSFANDEDKMLTWLLKGPSRKLVYDVSVLMWGRRWECGSTVQYLVCDYFSRVGLEAWAANFAGLTLQALLKKEEWADFWIASTGETWSFDSAVYAADANVHNKAMHALNGNHFVASRAEHEASPDFDTMLAAADLTGEPSPWQDLSDLNNLPFINTANSMDHNRDFYAILPLFQLNRTVSQDITTKCRGSWMYPRETRNNADIIVNQIQRLSPFSFCGNTNQPINYVESTSATVLREVAQKTGNMMNRGDSTMMNGFHTFDALQLAAIYTPQGLSLLQPLLRLRLFELVLAARGEKMNVSVASSMTSFAPRNAPPPLTDQDIFVTQCTSPAFGEDCLGLAGPVYPYHGGEQGQVFFHLSLETVPAASKSSALWVPGSLLDGDLVDGAGLALFLISMTSWPVAHFNVQVESSDLLGPVATQPIIYTHNSSQVVVPGPISVHVILPRQNASRNPESLNAAILLCPYRPSSGPVGWAGFPANTPLDINFIGGALISYPLSCFICSWTMNISMNDLAMYHTRLAALYDIRQDYGLACDLAAFATVRFSMPVTAIVAAPVELDPNDVIQGRQYTPAGFKCVQMTGNYPRPGPPPPDAYLPMFDPISWAKLVAGLIVPPGSMMQCTHPLFGHPLSLSFNMILGLKMAAAWTIEYAHLGLSTECWNRAWENGQNLAARRIVYGHFGSVFGGCIAPGPLTTHVRNVYAACQGHLPYRGTSGFCAFDYILIPRSRNFISPTTALGATLINYCPSLLDDLWFGFFTRCCPRWMNHLPVGGSMDTVMYAFKGCKAQPLNTRWIPPLSHQPKFSLEMGEHAELKDDERWNYRLESTYFNVALTYADSTAVLWGPGNLYSPYDPFFHDPEYCGNRNYSQAACFTFGFACQNYSCKEMTVTVSEANARNHSNSWVGQNSFPIIVGYVMMQVCPPAILVSSTSTLTIRSDFLTKYEEGGGDAHRRLDPSCGEVEKGHLGEVPPSDNAELSWLSERCHWPLEEIEALTHCARFDQYPRHEDFAAWKNLTSLLPPQELITLTVGELKKLVPKAKEFVTWSPTKIQLLEALLADEKPLFDDEHLLPIWPARTKVDLSIRRTRLRDVALAYRLGGELPQLHRILRLLPGMDIIAVVNICVFNWLNTDAEFNWFEFWLELGAFDAGVEHCCAVAAYVDARARLHSCSFPRRRVLQNATLAGFRNPPFPGFSLERETDALASSGRPHADCGFTSFADVARRCLQADSEAVPYIGFADFVESGDWETAGSSSEGVVKWQSADELGHFKAKKNLVPDVVDLGELAKKAESSVVQDNIAIVKSELGKLRMAVSSDLETYLKMSWLIKLMGHSYLRWQGSTLEEDVGQQHDRMIQMRRKLKGRWGLPFDYRKFDHQPTIDELKCIVKICIEQARRNVPIDKLAEYNSLTFNILSTFDHATLRCTDGEVTLVYRVRGGVMSGLRLTTILGNAWNTVMTNWCLDLLSCLGVYHRNIQAWVRGDDTALVFDSYAKGLLMRLLYEGLNAEAGEGKFGLFLGEFEFLRTWFDDDGCHGYSGRSMPGLTQRKPWSNTPWSDEGVLEQVYEATQVCRRREVVNSKLDLFWKAVCICWSQRRHASKNWICVPRSLGGLGLGEWDGSVPLERKKPTPKLPIKVLNQTAWRAERLQQEYASWYPITPEEAQKLAHESLLEKIALDDVPGLSKMLRKRVEALPTWKAHHVEVELGGTEPLLCNEIHKLEYLTPLPGQLSQPQEREGLFGRHCALVEKWRKFCSVLRVRGLTGCLRRFGVLEPGFVSDVRSMERKGLNQNNALEWVFGNAPLGSVLCLHPCLTRLLAQSVVKVLQSIVVKAKFSSSAAFVRTSCFITSTLERALVASDLVHRLYSW